MAVRLRASILAAVLTMACAPSSKPPATAEHVLPDNIIAAEDPASEEEQAEVERLLKQALAEAFDGAPKDLSHADRLKRLNWWVHTHTHLSNPEPPITLLNTLQERRGACGAVAWMFIEMAKRLGYPARARGIFCLPIQGGHVVAEVKYNGAWHLYDPTFGVYFTSDGSLDAPVVAYNHLEAFPEIGALNVFYPKAPGREGWYYPKEPYKTTAEMYQRQQPDYQKPLGSYDVFAANNCGSTAYEGNGLITLPMRWHMSGRSEYALGKLDGDSLDIIYQKNDEGVYDATSQYMLGKVGGSLGPLTVRHRYVIDGLARGERWRLRIDWLEGESMENVRYTIYGGIVRQDDTVSGRLSLDIEARAPVMEIVSWSDGDKFTRFDAVSLTRLP